MKTYVSYEPSGHSNYRKLEALITKLGGTVEDNMGSPFVIGGFSSPDAAKKYAAAIYATFKEKPQISKKAPFSFGEGKSIKLSELRALVKEEIQRILSEKEEDVFKKHQTKIAKRTLKMPDAIANVMGGPTKKQAKDYLGSQKKKKAVTEAYTNEPKPTKKPKKGYKWVQNLMSGKWIEEPEDLPFTQSVSSETYWSS